MLISEADGRKFLNRKRYEAAHMMAKAHIHEHHELYYLESGSTSYFCADSIYRLHTGDLMLVPKGVFHRTENAEVAGLERVLFSFDDSLLGEEYLPVLHQLAETPHIVLPELEKPAIRRLIEKIEAEEGREQPHSRLLQGLYFRELLILLLRHRVSDVKEEPTGTLGIAQAAARYISSHYREDLRLDSLAKRYAVSAGYFSKLFKKHTGVGVNEYITVVRIMAAKEMLEAGNASVTEVAFSCGFNDSNYFSQIFKRVTGMTPKRYALGRGEEHP